MKIFLVTLVLGFSATPVLAVSDLVFSTQPQTIGAGTISEKLIVSSGEAVGETADLKRNSSSVAGEFSSSNTNWQTLASMSGSDRPGDTIILGGEKEKPWWQRIFSR
ncbi:hypothetical protein IT398_00570 [Candidatus Nomurabacteria bacterium]|nr:hypothetical protein [Candidatus Nomurabacteria bacterium]